LIGSAVGAGPISRSFENPGVWIELRYPVLAKEHGGSDYEKKKSWMASIFHFLGVWWITVFHRISP
jgi:hypothetical protein